MQFEVMNAEAAIDIEVTPEMTARLDVDEIHALYSTFWLARHVELAARRVIEPHFDEGENAVGAALHIKHVDMAPVGARVRIRAWTTLVEGNLIRCNFEAHHGEVLIAHGTQDQVCLPAAKIAQRIARAYDRLD